MKKIFLLIAVAVMMAGCVHQVTLLGNPITDISVYHNKELKNGYSLITSPNINSENTVDIGVSLYEKEYIKEFDTYEVESLTDAVIKIPGSVYTIRANGNKLPLYSWGKDNYKAMCSYNGRKNVCLIDTSDSGYFNHAAYGDLDHIYEIQTRVKYSLKRTPPVVDNKFFKYMALYQGISDNKIKISFREFKGDLARPAFTQDINYELNKDDETIIGFKGLRIKVIKADNASITYIVLKDYD